MSKIKLPIPVIVEGRYDKIKLSAVADGMIITTDGFGIFKKKEKQALIRSLAARGGIIVLTDSDGAGGVIRSHLAGIVPKDKIFNLYIPKIKGKESRKATPSKEGTLGVEGMSTEVLRGILIRFCEANGIGCDRGADGVGDADGLTVRGEVTKADFFAARLTGFPDSAARRDALAAMLGLPSGMTPNALLGAVNVLCARDEYTQMAAKLG